MFYEKFKDMTAFQLWQLKLFGITEPLTLDR